MADTPTQAEIDAETELFIRAAKGDLTAALVPAPQPEHLKVVCESRSPDGDGQSVSLRNVPLTLRAPDSSPEDAGDRMPATVTPTKDGIAQPMGAGSEPADSLQSQLTALLAERDALKVERDRIQQEFADSLVDPHEPMALYKQIAEFVQQFYLERETNREVEAQLKAGDTARAALREALDEIDRHLTAYVQACFMTEAEPSIAVLHALAFLRGKTREGNQLAASAPERTT